MGRQIRRTEIHARRVRTKRLKQLQARYKDSKSASEKEEILAKVAKRAPWLAGEKFLAMVKGK